MKKNTVTAKLFGIKAIPYWYIAPFVIIYLIFQLAPIIYTFVISLFSWNGFDSANRAFIGLQNYASLLHDARFWKALKNTVVLMVLIIPAQLILGMLLSLLLYDKRTKHAGLFRLFCFLPYLTAPVAVGVIFSILFDTNYGVINKILGLFGVAAVGWTTAPFPTKMLVALVVIWQNFGYSAILFMAGLTNINPDLLEAASIDGANSWKKFFHVTLPLLRPTVIFVVLTTMISCFQLFDVPYLMFPNMVGGPDSAVLTGMGLMYDTAFGSVMQFGYGAAISYALFLVIAIISWVSNKIMAEKE